MKLKIQNPKTISRRITIFLLSVFVFIATNNAIGQITLNKTIVQQSICNQFNVNLSITGVSSPAPVDAILVIDKSGSMAYGSPSSMSYAKTAAINFVRKLFNPVNNPGNINRIGLVSFSTTASLDRQLSSASDSTIIINAINAMTANGNTDIADAFYQAGKEMKSRGRTACNVLRSIVLFTDGSSNQGSTYDASTDHYAGSSCASAPTSANSCTIQAYTQGQAAQSFVVGGVTYPTQVFTVGLFGGISGAEQTLAVSTLTLAQNAGFFQTESAADLNGIFNTILNQLLWAAQAVPGIPMVTDTITSGFTLVPGTLVASTGTASASGQNISWNISQINNGTVTLTYSVTAQNSSSCGIHKVGNSWIYYKDPSCNIIKNKFPNPDVCVPCPQVSQILLSQTGCSSAIQYSSTLNPAEITCNIGTQFYSWEFTMNSIVVGSATGLSGTFTIPSQYATPTCNGTIKGVLSYNSGSGCKLVLGEYTFTNLVIDNAGPTWTTAAGSLDRTIECNIIEGLNVAQSLAPIAIDNCSSVTYIKTSGSFVPGSCGATGTYTNTWVAKDACLNTSTIFIQVITIIDNTAPIWATATGTLDRTVECSNAAGLTAAQLLAPIATDNCGSVTYTKTSGSFVPGSCGATGTYTNTWLAKDACLNTSTIFTQVITITDKTAPSWTTGVGSLNRSVECSDAAGLTAAQLLAPLATDNCGSVTYTKTSGSFVPGSCGATGTYTNTWLAKDACLNTSTIFTQVITITDNTAPTWTTATGTLDRTIECSDVALLTSAQLLAPLATDNCGSVTYTKTSGSFVPGSCGATGTYTNTWLAKDACLNTSTIFTQVITITDNTAPTWTTATGTLDRTIECSDVALLTSAQLLAPVATDNCGSVTYTKTSGSFVPGSCGATGTYTNTWLAKDACLNTGTIFTQVITITDNTAPTWTTASGTLNRAVECSDAAGLTAAQILAPIATDNCGSVTYTKTSGSFVPGSCGATGTYTNTWLAKDACLNTSTIFIQVITITDQTAPTWTTASGTLNRAVECSDAAGLTAAQSLAPVATDNCGSVTYTKTSGTFAPGSCGATGTYTNTWIAKDACLNTGTIFTQVITITDNTAPTWTTASGTLDRAVECSDEAGLTAAQILAPVATDNCGSVTYTKTSGSFVAGSCGATGTYTNTWIAKDACLNTSTIFTQVITITDNTAPSWTTGPIALNRSVECSDAAGLTAAQLLAPIATDNCGSVTYTKTSGTFVPGSCGATGTYTNTWVAKDACLNTGTIFTQVITITDNTAPTWTTATGALNRTIECSDSAGLTAAQILAPLAIDNCGSVTYTKTSGTFVPGSCGATGTYTNTWIAKDACLNTGTIFTQVITITDNTAPTWTTATGALNRTIECSDAAGLTAAQSLAPVATDNCGSVTYTKTSGTFAPGSCGATGTYTNTWIAKDACLNTGTIFTQVITITDNTAPTWTTATGALNRTIECSDAAGLTAAQSLAPVATDNCGSVTYTKTSGTFAPGSCGATGTYTNTWIAKDACLNTGTIFTQVITITDNTAPTWTTASGTLDRAVECSDEAGLTAAQILAPVATDNCGSVTYTKTSGSFVAGSCGATGTYTNTWIAKDACLNTSTIFTQVITITDNTAPSWTTGPIALNRSVECSDAAGLTAAQLLAPIATDNCGSVTYTKTSGTFVPGSCGATGTYTNTWVAKDACLNTGTIFTQVITITDQTAPSLTGTLPVGQTGMNLCYANIPAGPTANDIKALYSDNCGGLVIVTKSGSPTGTDCNWSVTYTYEVKDACNNIVTPSPTVIYNGGDTSNPIIVCPTVPSSLWPNSGPNYIQTGTSWDATATDNCSTPIVVFTLSGATTSPNNLTTLDGVTFNYGSTLVTWTATDACGNTDSCTYTINVSDNTAPEISCPATINVTCIDLVPSAYASLIEFINAGGSVSDNTGIDSSSFTLISQASNEQTCPETITRVYQIADIIGNTSQCTQIIIVNDNIAPTIITQASDQTVECDGDENTTDLTAWLSSNGGTVASDNCSGITWSNDFTSLSELCGSTGSAVVTFTATDACGNTSTSSATFTIVDTTPPTITTQASDQSVECDGNGNSEALNAWLNSNGGAAASDICSGTVTWSNDFTSLSELCGSTGSAVVTFTATDACGNTSTSSATFTIVDTTPPTITTQASDQSVECDGNGNSEALNAWLNSNGGAAASDICSGTVTWSNDFTSLSELCGSTGSAVVTFTATDACGNTSTSSATFTIVDTTPPTITTQASDTTVECDGAGNTAALNAWLSSNGGAAASDICSGTVTWSNDFTSLSDLCGATGSAVVTFTATDACGNTSTSSATFTIVDTTPPTITTQASNQSVECDGAGNSTALNSWLASNGGATASDICSGTVTWSNDFTSLSNLCGSTGSAVVTFTASDACGNTSTSSATFTIVDTTPPTITTQASNQSVECDGAGNSTALNAWLASNGGAAASDICSGTVTWSNDFTSLSNLCGSTGSAVVTFTASDACGNTSTSSATFTIVDTTPPTITTQASNQSVECDGNGNTTALNAWLASNGGAVASDICSGTVTWSNDFTSLSNLCGSTGLAVVTFTASDACGNTSTSSATFTIVDTTPPVLTCPAAIITCSLEFNLGTATATDNCDPNVTITNNAPAIFPIGVTIVTWTATDACGNTSTCTQSVTVSTISATAETTPVSCFGGSDGSIDVTATGGMPPYNYSLNGSTPQSSHIFTDLATGTYTITVSDATNQCTFNFDVTIGTPDSISVDPKSITKSNCSGYGDGKIELSVKGGSGSYLYSWSNGANTSEALIDNIDAGTYSVTVTDANGCEMLKSAIVVAPDHEKNLIKINNAFSPNGDGINDYWVIQNIELYPENEVVVLNRWGNEVYTMKHYDNSWNGSNLSEGTYLFILKGICDTEINSYITIIR